MFLYTCCFLVLASVMAICGYLLPEVVPSAGYRGKFLESLGRLFASLGFEISHFCISFCNLILCPLFDQISIKKGIRIWEAHGRRIALFSFVGAKEAQTGPKTA